MDPITAEGVPGNRVRPDGNQGGSAARGYQPGSGEDTSEGPDLGIRGISRPRDQPPVAINADLDPSTSRHPAGRAAGPNRRQRGEREHPIKGFRAPGTGEQDDRACERKQTRKPADAPFPSGRRQEREGHEHSDALENQRAVRAAEAE